MASTEKAKIPHWRDMDPSMESGASFLNHWGKRHCYPGVFDLTGEKFPDDTAPLWSAIKRLHDRVHSGESEFPIPHDHVHLDAVSTILAELI